LANEGGDATKRFKLSVKSEREKMKAIPHVRIAHLPTPVEPMARLSARLGGPTLLVKRDDQTGLALGGNKTRKLEYLIAEAQANGARSILTAGATQSNHCRQTAAAAARYGFECVLVLGGPQPETADGNVLLDHLFGARIVWAPPGERQQVFEHTFDEMWAAGKRPYKVPYGGSNEAGAAAYAFAFRELMDQGLKPDWIVFASSSGGTQAGLALGAKLAGYAGKVLGISVDEPQDVLQERVADLASRTADFLGEKVRLHPGEILVNADYLGEGYAVMGAPEVEAIRMFACNEGLLLDPVYTGRAAAGMIDLIRKGAFKSGETILFWHTGGSPALFANRYQQDLLRE
jgi:D-cysteine desulfhydrase family pyridoxal phosphate-dependent enzyme